MVATESSPPRKLLDSVERNALLNAIRHGGKSEVGAVLSKILGEFPDMRSTAREVAKVVASKVSEVNAMTLEEQVRLLRERFPEAEPGPREKEGRVGLPPLPNAVKGTVVLRLPPEPSGFMHIGHAMAFTINYTYRQTYDGKLWLRFEDTNPRMVEKRYYQDFRDGIKWLGMHWDREKSVSSDLEVLYEYGQRLLAEGNAYACGCAEAKVKKLRFEGKECEHRDQPFRRSLAIWDGMLSKKYREGEYVIRVRGDMASLDTSLRDPNIFRVIRHKHPLTGSKYVLWPTYDFEVVVEDEICKITHVLRSSEFHLALQELLRKFLSFQPITVLQFSRFNFRGTPVSKRLLRPLVDEKLVSGWDDPRMPTIAGVRRRGILPETIREFTLQVGYTKSEHEFDWSLLFAVNRKLLDPKTKRLYFVPKPVRLSVEGAPKKGVTIPFHPEKDLGARTIPLSGRFFIPAGDLSSLRIGETFRLMELYNVKLLKKSARRASAKYITEDLVAGTKKVQWTTEENEEVEVLEPGPLYEDGEKFNKASLGRTRGTVEKAFGRLATGEIVQFPRYGFCRVDSRSVCILAHK